MCRMVNNAYQAKTCATKHATRFVNCTIGVVYLFPQTCGGSLQVLSDEIQLYHGLIRYDVFTGNRQALRSLMLDVARKPSVTFVYRVSGISRIFTHPYVDNFYSKKLGEENLSSVIDKDLVGPLRTATGHRSVAVSMTLMARRCPENTVISFAAQSACFDIPLNITHICTVTPAFVHSLHFSLMTRRYAGDDTLTEDVFFEVEKTFATKAFLILRQLQQSMAPPFTFILERYEMEPQSRIHYYNLYRQATVQCAATPFGFTTRTKAELAKL
ncbi:uncharacterized protein LOC144123826 [Amblyomma americanum]